MSTKLYTIKKALTPKSRFLDEIKHDIAVVKERDPAAKSDLEVLLLYSGLHAVISHRVAHKLYKNKHPTEMLPTEVVSVGCFSYSFT